MKNFFLSVLIFFNITISCIAVKAQDNNLNAFFNNHITFYSLGNFTGSNDIIIYDEKKQIQANELEYKYKTDSVSQNIKIVHSTPNVTSYLLLSDCIINENLAVISFASSNHKKYIIYTLKRKNSADKWWYILSVHEGTMN